MTEQEGLFTIPTRVYLTASQRAKLYQLVREQQTELGDLITRMVAEQLDALPDAEPASAQVSAADTSDELRKRRADLRRLLAQRNAYSGAGPAWLNGYINELEMEIRQLENR